MELRLTLTLVYVALEVPRERARYDEEAVLGAPDPGGDRGYRGEEVCLAAVPIGVLGPSSGRYLGGERGEFGAR